jgi:probable HAF family extracellular repeat protein
MLRLFWVILWLVLGPLPVGAVTYSVTDLGTFGGTNSEGLAINGRGQVTGWAYGVETNGFVVSHAFLYGGGTLTDLGALTDGTVSAGLAINESGQVTGYSYTMGNLAFHPFLYSGGTLTDLGTFGGTQGYGFALNASGQVTGLTEVTPNGPIHAFRYSGGTMSDLGTLGGPSSAAFAINTNGQVTGWADLPGDSASHAFVYGGGPLGDLGTFGGTISAGRAINDSGQVTGSANTSGDASSHAFLYSGGPLVDLGTLGGANSNGSAINVNGQVTGFAETPFGRRHAFLYSGGTLTDIGTFGGLTSEGLAINASGQVTGYADTTDTTDTSHAFLYSGGTLFDLNDLIPPDSGWVLERGTAINDAGQITGFGTIGGQTHAFLAFTCQSVPAGTPCPNAGDLCTLDVCDATSTCTHTMAPAPTCTPPTEASAASLLLQAVAPGHNRAQFKWRKGPVVPLTAFGNPGGSERSRLCVYDETAPATYALALEGSPSVSGGGVWTGHTTGWTFKSTTGSPDGITGVTLTAGTAPLKARVQVTAKANPAFPEGLPLQKNPSVVAQFKTSSGGCWGATFSTSTRNTVTKFKAKSD